LPERNAKDIGEVPEDIRDKMKFLLVNRMEDVLPVALADKRGSAKRRTSRRAKRSVKNPSGRQAHNGTKVAARNNKNT